MIHLLVVSHGNFAEGLLDSVSMISGEHEGLDHLSLARGMGVDEFTDAFAVWLDAHPGVQVLVLADMIGGSPFNVAARAAHENERVSLWYGVNLSILLDALNKRGSDMDALLQHLKKVAPLSAGHAQL